MPTNTPPNFSIKETTIEDWNRNSIHTKELQLFHGFSPLKDLSISEQFNTIETNLAKITSGNIVNPTDQLPVTHHECRSPKNESTESVIELIKQVRNNVISIAGEPIQHVCQIGIGGSISGPKALCQALKIWGYKESIKISFISNQDEQQILKILKELPIEHTLFIIASKSGTTIEVTKAISAITHYLSIPENQFYQKHCIAITTKSSPLSNKNCLRTIHFKESIGGRFSTTSPIGTTIIGLSFGEDVLNEFLTSAHETDTIELHPNTLDRNIAFHTALLNVHYRNTHQLSQLGIIPYGHALSELPLFLVQLISESLGKSTSIDGHPSTTHNCPHILHGQGPDAQHSFFQQLHQAQPPTPCEFIFTKPSTENQYHMLQQICGQMVALAHGKPSENHHHHFSGNRPSILIYLKSQTPAALGALIASYENRVMFESLLLNINAFDQPGVELGKSITKSISNTSSDIASRLFQSITNE